MNKLPEHTLNAMVNDDSPGGWSNQTVKPMAAELLELRAEIAQLRAIVETPIKLPPKMPQGESRCNDCKSNGFTRCPHKRANKEQKND